MTGNANLNTRQRLCFDFNHGSCTFGKRCKFDHHCSFCNKFGHGSYNCRKAARTTGNPSNTPPKNGHGGNDRWTKYEQNINKINNNSSHPNGGKQ